MEKPLFKINDLVKLGKRVLTITKIDGFGITPHYGFYWMESNSNYQSGWIPVAVLNELGQPWKE